MAPCTSGRVGTAIASAVVALCGMGCCRSTCGDSRLVGMDVRARTVEVPKASAELALRYRYFEWGEPLEAGRGGRGWREELFLPRYGLRVHIERRLSLSPGSVQEIRELRTSFGQIRNESTDDRNTSPSEQQVTSVMIEASLAEELYSFARRREGLERNALDLGSRVQERFQLGVVRYWRRWDTD
jgi:hypothetical protein